MLAFKSPCRWASVWDWRRFQNLQMRCSSSRVVLAICSSVVAFSVWTEGLLHNKILFTHICYILWLIDPKKRHSVNKALWNMAKCLVHACVPTEMLSSFGLPYMVPCCWKEMYVLTTIVLNLYSFHNERSIFMSQALEQWYSTSSLPCATFSRQKKNDVPLSQMYQYRYTFATSH